MKFSKTSTTFEPRCSAVDWQIKNYGKGYFSQADNLFIMTNNIILTSTLLEEYFYNCDNPLDNNILVSTGNLIEIGLNNSNIALDIAGFYNSDFDMASASPESMLGQTMKGWSISNKNQRHVSLAIYV